MEEEHMEGEGEEGEEEGEEGGKALDLRVLEVVEGGKEPKPQPWAGTSIITTKAQATRLGRTHPVITPIIPTRRRAEEQEAEGVVVVGEEPVVVGSMGATAMAQTGHRRRLRGARHTGAGTLTPSRVAMARTGGSTRPKGGTSVPTDRIKKGRRSGRKGGGEGVVRVSHHPEGKTKEEEGELRLNRAEFPPKSRLDARGRGQENTQASNQPTSVCVCVFVCVLFVQCGGNNCVE